MTGTDDTFNLVPKRAIVVACRELGIDTLLSFDADFDTIPDLTRLK